MAGRDGFARSRHRSRRRPARAPARSGRPCRRFAAAALARGRRRRWVWRLGLRARWGRVGHVTQATWPRRVRGGQCRRQSSAVSRVGSSPGRLGRQFRGPHVSARTAGPRPAARSPGSRRSASATAVTPNSVAPVSSPEGSRSTGRPTRATRWSAWPPATPRAGRAPRRPTGLALLLGLLELLPPPVVRSSSKPCIGGRTRAGAGRPALHQVAGHVVDVERVVASRRPRGRGTAPGAARRRAPRAAPRGRRLDRLQQLVGLLDQVLPQRLVRLLGAHGQPPGERSRSITDAASSRAAPTGSGVSIRVPPRQQRRRPARWRRSRSSRTASSSSSRGHRRPQRDCRSCSGTSLPAHTCARGPQRRQRRAAGSTPGRRGLSRTTTAVTASGPHRRQDRTRTRRRWGDLAGSGSQTPKRGLRSGRPAGRSGMRLPTRRESASWLMSWPPVVSPAFSARLT